MLIKQFIKSHFIAYLQEGMAKTSTCLVATGPLNSK